MSTPNLPSTETETKPRKYSVEERLDYLERQLLRTEITLYGVAEKVRLLEQRPSIKQIVVEHE